MYSKKSFCLDTYRAYVQILWTLKALQVALKFQIRMQDSIHYISYSKLKKLLKRAGGSHEIKRLAWRIFVVLLWDCLKAETARIVLPSAMNETMPLPNERYCHNERTLDGYCEIQPLVMNTPGNEQLKISIILSPVHPPPRWLAAIV